MNVWVIMDDDEFVAVAVDEATARDHAEARFTARLEKGHYGKDAERRIQWVTGGQGPELHRYGALFGRTGWHSTGFWLVESPLIGSEPKGCAPVPCPSFEDVTLEVTARCSCLGNLRPGDLFAPGCPIHDPEKVRRDVG